MRIAQLLATAPGPLMRCGKITLQLLLDDEVEDREDAEGAEPGDCGVANEELCFVAEPRLCAGGSVGSGGGAV